MRILRCCVLLRLLNCARPHGCLLFVSLCLFFFCSQGFDCSPVAFRYRPAISAECRYEWQSLSNHFKGCDYSALNLASLHIWLLANLNPRAHWAVWLHHHPLSPPNHIRNDKSHKENTYWTYGQRKMRSRMQKCFPITDSYRPFSKKNVCHLMWE